MREQTAIGGLEINQGKATAALQSECHKRSALQFDVFSNTNPTNPGNRSKKHPIVSL
jgi:hypothetical protein